MTAPNPCLAAALAYATSAQRPLFVFPAKPGEKKSRLSKQFAEDGKNWGMTNNSKTIEKYWRQFPDSNVCIVTGEINSIFVLETDTEAHGKDGATELKKLIDANKGEWPTTMTARSPSGSIHYYFAWPEGDVTILNSDSKLAPGVDIRGDGGMVVAPPSYAPKHDGYYEWISPAGVGIKNAPPWLLKLLIQKPPKRNIGEPQADITKVKTAMELIPNGKVEMGWEVSDFETGEVNTRAGWEGWNTIGMALFRATGGSDEGFEIFHEWCRKNRTKYNEKYTHHTWYGRYRRSPPRHVGAGTLFAIAETEGPGWQKVYDHEHMDEIIEAKVEEANSKIEEKCFLKRDKTTDKNILEIEQYMALKKIPLYVFGNTLVRPIIKSVRAMQDEEGPHMTKTAELYDVVPQYLKVKALEHIVFLKYDARAKKWIPTKPDLEIFNDLMAKVGEWKFPTITAVILTPTMRADGSIFSHAGYDPLTRLLMIEPPQLPPMPDKSSKGDAYEAIDLLEDLISEFSFIDNVARSVALAAMITPIVRGAFQSAPLFVNKAPTPASGKSYLFDVVAAIAIGQRMPTTAAGRNEEETEKRLGASLLVGQPLINIDNVVGELSGSALCQYLERPVVNIRVLGKSENRTVETSCSTLFATGNNLTLVGDITRRAVICTLDTNQERPEDRVYKGNPFKAVLANRGKYIAACLTICRAYIQAGSPSRAQRLGSYEGWSDVVRSAIIWLGRADPVASMELARAEDPTIIDLETTLIEWAKVIGTGEKNALPLNKVLEIATSEGTSGLEQFDHQYPDFFDAIFRISSIYNRDPDLKRFNNWARINKGRIVNNMRLMNRVPPGGGLARWWVQLGDDPTKDSNGLRHVDDSAGKVVPFSERNKR